MRNRKFVVTLELILLTVIISIAAIAIFASTTDTLRSNFDAETKTKLQRDLWSNQ